MRGPFYSVLFATICLAVLGGCTIKTAETPRAPYPGGWVPPSPTSVSSPTIYPNALTPAATADTRPQVEFYQGTGEVVGSGRSSAAAPASGEVTLDFVDADVKSVAQSVLGEILKLPYAVSPAVAGQITLRTSGAIARSDVVPALEAALRTAGAALIVNDGVYTIVPQDEALRRSGAPRGSGAEAPGFGVEIVPLKYLSAGEVASLLEPISPSGAILRADTARNVLVISGTGDERATLIETISLFDVDWLKAMSFAMIRPRHASAAGLAQELEKVFEGSGNPIAGVVRFIPLPRTNSLLAVSPRREYLNQVSTWVARLDVAPVPSGRRLYYLPLQNAKARDVAETLQGLFTTGAVPPLAASTASPAIASEANADLEAGAPATATPITIEMRGASIVTDEANNALIIRAEEAELRAIEAVVRQMDRATNQVLIEALIAEVTLNDTLKYGVEWFFKNYEQTYTFGPSATPAARFPGFAFTYTVPNVQIALNALEDITSINVVSSPKIMTLDNAPATLQVGDQVPVVTQAARSIDNPDAPLVNTIQFRDTGIILTVTPRISNSGDIVLEVSQEVSDVVPTTTSGIDSPTIRQRKISTTVSIRDGETMALGGLIRDSQSRGRGGVPILKDVPLMGELFSTTNDRGEKTELLIFLTPRIIRNLETARDATRDLQEQMETLRRMLAPPE